MHGEIGVESVVGEGSTFWFTVTLEKDSAVSQTYADSSLTGVRVLIVDDNATNRTILNHYTRSWAMQPDSVASGKEALEILRARAAESRPFQLVLLDMHMPEMDGAMLADEIGRDSALENTQLVLLTSASTAPACKRLAARLSKPVKPSALFQCLSRLQHGEAKGQEVKGPSPAPSEARDVRGRILIAEDNPVNQRVARLQVRKFGYEADVVANGEEALSALERLPYSLVLMDCHMPGMDGYEATRELRRRENGARRIPVIAMTANAYASDRQNCLDAGMDDYISKPVSLEDLGQVLTRWAGRSDM